LWNRVKPDIAPPSSSAQLKTYFSDNLFNIIFYSVESSSKWMSKKRDFTNTTPRAFPNNTGKYRRHYLFSVRYALGVQRECNFGRCFLLGTRYEWQMTEDIICSLWGTHWEYRASVISVDSFCYVRVTNERNGKAQERERLFSGAMAKFRKAILASSCLSVYPSVRNEELGCHCKDFHEMWRLIMFRKPVKKNSSFMEMR
jgi:hypothetical protein